MIVLTKDATRLPEIPGATYSQTLEGLTGADCLISNTDMPADSDMLIREHLEGWCMLVQIKIGPDMASSITDGRLLNSSFRMSQADASPQQKWLVDCGVYTKDSEGYLLINGKKTTDYGIPQAVKFSAYRTAIRSWQLRGGCYYHCYNKEDLVDFITGSEKWMIEHDGEITVDAIDRVEKVKIDNDPFQVIRPSTRGLDILAHMIGEESAKKMLAVCNGDVAMAFCHLSNPEDWSHFPKGLGKSHGNKFCDRMGIGNRILDLRNRSNGNGENEY